MNAVIFCVFCSLGASCLLGAEQGGKNDSLSPAVERMGSIDAIISVWYICQAGAGEALAPRQYRIGKLHLGMKDIIEIQVSEIRKSYDHGKLLAIKKEQMGKWVKEQKKALAVLLVRDRYDFGGVEISDIPELMKILNNEMDSAQIDRIVGIRGDIEVFSEIMRLLVDQEKILKKWYPDEWSPNNQKNQK